MTSPGPTTVDVALDPPGTFTETASRLPLTLCFLFLISGSSGLMYEVVWLRMLSRTLGSTVYAASTILAVFMAGLALGSFVIGRFADRVRRPLMLYAILEAGIGVTALLSLSMNTWPAPLYRAIYHFTGDSRAALTVGQVLLAMVALLIPTSLMGATLPTLCAYGVRRSAVMGRVVGTLYALNTLGAMAGVLVGGFVLIGAIGETHTVLVGAAINGLVAAVALVMASGRATNQIPDPQPATIAPILPPIDAADDAASRRVRRTVLVCFAISGFVSLALEIIWSRMLTLYLGTSIYAFSGMLAVMLAGIGLGGWFGGRVERWKNPLLVLVRLELAIAMFVAIGLTVFSLLENTPVFVPPLILVGPAGLLLGVAFPVAVRCYVDHARVIGRRVGELYAWNTIGCILGSLAGGFILMPLFGASHSGAILAGLTALSAIALLAVQPDGFRRTGLTDIALVVMTIVFIVLIGDPYRDVIFYRLYAADRDEVVFAHVEEASATTTAAGIPQIPLARSLLVNGYGMTSLLTGNKLMANLPLWLADSPRDSLVVCMGMGTTFRSAARHPEIDVTVVEIVPAVTRFMHFYHADADQVMAQPNCHVVVDDGRNYLLMHQRKFDTITIDPAPPICSAGTVNLYSREFFQLCAERIQPGGVVCLWLPPAPESEGKIIMRTFATVFPFVSVWAGPTYPGFYLLGTLQPVHDIESRVQRGFSVPAIAADMVEWDKSCATPAKVLALRICERDALLEFSSDRPVMSDDHPFTEFPLWRWVNGDPGYMRGLDAPALRQWLQQRDSSRD